MNESYTSEIVAMAWCDKTAFEMIQTTAGLSEKEIIDLREKKDQNLQFLFIEKTRFRTYGQTQKKIREP